MNSRAFYRRIFCAIGLETSPPPLLWIAALVLQCWGAPVAAQAQTTSVKQDAEANLGRLFFSAEARERLDRRRARDLPQDNIVEDVFFQLNGVVVRSSGARTVWVNQVPITEKDQIGVSVRTSPRSPSKATLRLGSEQTHRLTVGDSITLSNGQAEPLLGDGRITPSR